MQCDRPETKNEPSRGVLVAIASVSCPQKAMIKNKVVEAAGVEPASEKVHRKETTCVSGSLVFVPFLRIPAREKRLSLIDLGFPLQTEALHLSCEMTPLNQVQAHRPRAAT